MDTFGFRNAAALAGALALGTVVLAGCGEPGGAGGPAAPATSPAVAASPSPAASVMATVEGALVARLLGATDAFASPGGVVTRSLEGTTGFGSPTVLLVSETGTGDEAGWLEVLLPGRPNGDVGWVRSDAVDVREVHLAVDIDLAERELVLRDGDKPVWTTATAIGDADHPTPTGRFYVTDKLETGDPDGSYGPYALGLSARSEVLTEFAGGDGQVGIHGTNKPSSIGRAASHGCLRIDNALVTQLADLLPLGTPVTIR